MSYRTNRKTRGIFRRKPYRGVQEWTEWRQMNYSRDKQTALDYVVWANSQDPGSFQYRVMVMTIARVPVYLIQRRDLEWV